MLNHTELYEYRAKLLARILEASSEFCAACRKAKDPFLPLTEDGWNVHQIAAHVRDVDKQVYGMRLRRAVEEEHPVFQNFDGDAWQKQHYLPAESLDVILDEFLSNIHLLVGWLSSLPPAAWSRMTRHEVYGEFAMQTWAERGLAHIEEHLAAIEAGQG